MFQLRSNAILVLILSPAIAGAWSKKGTVYTTNGKASDVQAALDDADPDDTVLIPPGRHRWGTGVVVKTPVTLLGSGSGASTSSNSVIRDNQDPSDRKAILLDIRTEAGGFYRISNLRFEPGTDTGKKGTAVVRFAGESKSIRLDSCYFNDPATSPVLRLADATAGVIDSNVFYQKEYGSTLIWGYQSTWPDGSGKWGDGSWSSPVDWGGPESWYIENNVVDGPDDGSKTSVTDTYSGSRMVVRYNLLIDANLPTHGTGDGAGRHRGLRQFEIYGNQFYYEDISPSTNSAHIRGGSGIYFGNLHTNVEKGITFHHYRFHRPHGKFGFVDGTNAFDIPDLSDGKKTPGGAGDGVFAAGTMTSGTGNEVVDPEGLSGTYTKVVDSTASWTPGQWVGYVLKARVRNSTYNSVTRSGGDPAFPDRTLGVVIEANTSDTLYCSAAPHKPYKTLYVQRGQSYEIRRVELSLDMVGAGQCDYMPDKRASYPEPIDLNQQRAPWYVWGNEFDSPPRVHGAGAPGILENEHFFNQVEDFDGSEGIGVGRRGRRPSNPTRENVGYWATNAGSDGVLYRWDGSSWQEHWRPFEYPHPLREE